MQIPTLFYSHAIQVNSGKKKPLKGNLAVRCAHAKTFRRESFRFVRMFIMRISQGSSMHAIHLRRRLSVGSFIAACAGAIALGSLSGCANFTDVHNEENDLFMVSATGVSYTMSIPDLTAAAKEKANAFCEKQKLNADLRQLVRGWRPMQVELYFRCRPEAGSLRASLN